MTESETLTAFLNYLDSLSKSELDADSLSGHARTYLETIKTPSKNEN